MDVPSAVPSPDDRDCARAPIIVLRLLFIASLSVAAGGGCATPGRSAPTATSRGASPSTSVVDSAVPAPPAPRFPPEWPFPQGAPAVSSARGMVVTDAALATKVGADVLTSGGNAVDAAVAAALALAVVFPTAGNLGGGGFFVARVGGASYALDFRETAPARATRDMFLGPDGKATRDSREGVRSVGVPGSVAGLWEAWRALGSKRKTWADLVAPAIDLAENGFRVDEAFDQPIAVVKARLAKFPESAALFLPDGGPPAVGSTWKNRELAEVLRRIAAQGPPGFYEGPVADAIARTMQDGGGLVTAGDLKTYRAKWRTPLEYSYRGRRIVGMPPPSSGGVTMAMIAHVLEGWDLHALGWHSADHVHLAVEAMRRAFAARNAKLGDPDFVNNPVSDLVSDAWARAQRATIRLDRATPTAELFPAAAAPPRGGNTGDAQRRDGPHTTHLSVVDASGNAVALTTTLNAWFGSGVTVAGQGFLLNDEMDDFASVPGTANAFGLVQGEPNVIEPGKRMLSSMSPTIVLSDSGGVELALGAAGGSRIITTVFEELSNVLDFGMGAGDAVRAPRFHQQDLPDVVFLEPHSLPDDVRRALEKMGHVVKDVEHLADAPAIGLERGMWSGAAEPRRAGSLALGP